MTRFREVVDNALLAEELGFDGFGVGERHERPFISSSPPVVLSHIAALTSRIRLFTAVTTLSLLDPVRAFEDYATLDHLSGGRLELIIGKGNGAAQARAVPRHRRGPVGPQRRGLRAVPPALARGQGHLVRPGSARRWTTPRRGRGRCSSRSGSGTAARPARIRSTWPPATATRCSRRTSPIPIEPYAELVRHYRERWAHYGHDPADALVGAGTAGYYAARTSQEAIATYRPVFEARLARSSSAGPRAGLPDARGLRRAQLGPDRQPAADHRQGPPLPRAVRARGLHLHADAGGLTDAQHRDTLELFQSEIAPVLRREIPDPPWMARCRVPVPADLPPRPSPSGARPMTDTPLVHPRPRPDPLRLDRAPRRCATASTSPSRPSAFGYAALLVRRAPPQPRRRRHLARRRPRPDRRRHPTHPARLRRRAARATAPRCPSWRSSACSTRCTPAGSTWAWAAPAAAPSGRRAVAAPAASDAAVDGARPSDGLLHPAAVLLRASCSARRASPCSSGCCSSRAPSRRTTPSRSTTSWRCIAGTYRSPDGVEAHVVPGEGADAAAVDPRQQRRRRAPRSPGARGLPFAANYHVSPATRAGGRRRLPGGVPPVRGAGPAVRPRLRRRRRRPTTRRRARELATGYGLWVRSIRTGAGAIPFPTPDEAARHAGPTRTGPWCRTGSTPSSSVAGAGRRPARTVARRHRRGRAGRHHHHPRPRRPGPLLRAAGPGVGTARLPVSSERHLVVGVAPSQGEYKYWDHRRESQAEVAYGFRLARIVNEGRSWNDSRNGSDTTARFPQRSGEVSDTRFWGFALRYWR